MRYSTLDILIPVALAVILSLTGCAPTPPTPPPPQEPPQVAAERELHPIANSPASAVEEIPIPGLDIVKIRDSEAHRGLCYNLEPARITKARGKHHHSIGRCQPQSLIYARCRTGFSSCRLGNTSPVQWFACARKSGDISLRPLAGSVMVLDGNSQRGMPTGHPVYVEQATANADGTWRLRLSHTNYDRQCHLDQDATVAFNPGHMTATFLSGPWKNWASDLRVLGFIVR